jgi:hypothetical protein
MRSLHTFADEDVVSDLCLVRARSTCLELAVLALEDVPVRS